MPSLSPVLRIEPAGRDVPVADGQSLLEAAQAAGIRLARSCRNGTCRACRCRLVAGRVRYRIEWPGLLPEEKAEGWILPCVALPDDGLVVIEADAAAKA
jgi:ferredoxin